MYASMLGLRIDDGTNNDQSVSLAAGGVGWFSFDGAERFVASPTSA
jgi:hypothetical protein